jgi:hypothetical protein
MYRTETLNETSQAIVDANGNAAIEIGPIMHGETWHVKVVAINVSTAVNEPQGRSYLNGVFVGGSYTASMNSNNDPVTLPSGQKYRCVWTGADVGATASLTLLGLKEKVGG